jgi:hypothetical protein
MKQNLRVLFAFTLCALGSFLGMLSFASAGSTAVSSDFGGPDPTIPGAPRYQVFSSGGSSGQPGEFNIGFNPATGHIFAMNSGPIYRITTAERGTPALPECCPEIWEDKSSGATRVGVDPILWTDQKTGRTFASNSTAGANAVYAYSDNDGDLWIPLAASPPNGGTDHETIGSGPYPPLLRVIGGPGDPANPVTKGEAVYYCSQSWPLGPATCQRSDDLGASYGPGTLAYTGMSDIGCNFAHGHIHVAPDGTAWLPVSHCNGSQGGAFSADAGTTWTEFVVHGNNDLLSGQYFEAISPTDGGDASLAIDSESTAYYCYVNNEGDENHAHVAVGKRNGTNIDWIRDVDVGASHGIVNAVFPEAVGGSAGRAACGFLGTNVPGNFQGAGFSGDWYLFIATTYDEGQNWVTVNATPNSPVQSHAGVCLQGTDCGAGAPRNLLDFNEVTLDDKGRVLFGYSNGLSASMRVARQIGGKTLLAQFDTSSAEPAVPKAPCLAGTRNTSGVHLSWKAPDNGGADIVSYAIYRGTASGTETLLLVTGTNKTSFDDFTADPSQPVYYYIRAINSVNLTGGALSQEVNFAATPGIQLLGITSNKTHGTTDFSVDLPLNGSGIECRSGGANGDYKMVFNFANPVTGVAGVSVVTGTGSINGTAIQNGDYIVDLAGVTNAQAITVQLTNVSDSAGNNLLSVSATMNVLIGDTTADGNVNSTDIAQTKSQSGQTVSASNFREDITVDGNINSTDIAVVKSKSGTALPP